MENSLKAKVKLIENLEIHFNQQMENKNNQLNEHSEELKRAKCELQTKNRILNDTLKKKGFYKRQVIKSKQWVEKVNRFLMA